MKKHIDKYKLAAIILIPYLIIFAYLLLYFWRETQMSFYQLEYDAYYDAFFYDNVNRIMMIVQLFEGAMIALWVYLIYTCKKKSTVIAVLINVIVLLCFIVYTMNQPQQDADFINALYFLLLQFRDHFLMYTGMHIFALIFLFLSKDQFQNTTLPSTQTEEVYSISDTAQPLEQSNSIEDDTVIQKQPVKKSIQKVFEKPKPDGLSDDDVWKPKKDE